MIEFSQVDEVSDKMKYVPRETWITDEILDWIQNY